MLTPDLLTFLDGSPVRTPDDWRRRREELAAALLPIEFGGLPPKPSKTIWETIHRSVGPRIAPFPNCTYLSGLVHVEGGTAPFSFHMSVFLPPPDKHQTPCPVVLTPDDCWWWLTTAMVNEALTRGFAVASFNRCEIARDLIGPYDDPDSHWRETGIYPIFPGSYGAISAWAWGCHRAVDALLQIPEIDSTRIAITGHSRGGKTVLLAAATDERIALVGDNMSGCCGSSSVKQVAPGGEGLGSITKDLGKWFTPELAGYAGREDELPYDQHFLCALIAPRALRVNVGLADLWSNPTGTWAVHLATREAYRLLGAEDAIAVAFREGPHRYDAGDWSRFLDFCVWRLCAGLRPTDLDRRPSWAK